jgi:hypothetical protein
MAGTLLSRHHRMLLGGGAPNPIAITGGTVSSWLQNNTVGAVTTVPNLIAGRSSAVQATAINRPVGQANGSMTFSGTQWLTWALDAGNNGAQYFWVAGWVKTTVPATNQVWLGMLLNGASSASVNKFRAAIATAHFSQYLNGNNGRQLNGAAATTAATFLTYEWNNDEVTEANREVYSIGGVVVAPSSYSAVGTGVAPSPLPTPTGNAIIGNAAFGSVSLPLFGTMGRDLWTGNAKMTGVTQGCLTPAARVGLMNILPLT